MTRSRVSLCLFFRESRPEKWASPKTADGLHTLPIPTTACGAVEWMVPNACNLPALPFLPSCLVGRRMDGRLLSATNNPAARGRFSWSRPTVERHRKRSLKKKIRTIWVRSPDGKQLIFGRAPFLPGTTDTIVIKTFDLATKKVSTVPGSENLYAPRWSPDGHHLVASSADSKKLLLFDFKTEKWTDWVSSPYVLVGPSWSKDGAYVYYVNRSGDRGTYRRIKVGANKPEEVVDFGELHLYTAIIGLTPDDAALFTRDMSVDEIYSLDLDLPYK
jgi:WD40 repeat protein